MTIKELKDIIEDVPDELECWVLDESLKLTSVEVLDDNNEKIVNFGYMD